MLTSASCLTSSVQSQCAPSLHIFIRLGLSLLLTASLVNSRISSALACAAQPDSKCPVEPGFLLFEGLHLLVKLCLLAQHAFLRLGRAAKPSRSLVGTGRLSRAPRDSDRLISVLVSLTLVVPAWLLYRQVYAWKGTAHCERVCVASRKISCISTRETSSVGICGSVHLARVKLHTAVFCKA